MALTEAGLNVAADAVAGVVGFVSLHSANPGTNGANELTGGSPAYARKAATWNAATGGNADSSNAPAFDVPAGADVAYVGFWSAVTGGTFYGSAAVTTESFASQGTYTLNDADITIS